MTFQRDSLTKPMNGILKDSELYDLIYVSKRDI